MRLWADVGPEERLTEALLRAACEAGEAEAEWMRGVLERMLEPQCQAAVRWYADKTLWVPCRNRVLPGATLCWSHGGPKQPPKPSSPFFRCRIRAQVRRLRIEVRAAEVLAFYATNMVASVQEALTLAEEQLARLDSEEDPLLRAIEEAAAETEEEEVEVEAENGD